MAEHAPIQTLVDLCDRNLADLPHGVACPTYDRSKLSAGIVHIGLGNFHRAHQAWYLHRLMQKGIAHDWAIIGAGVRPADEVQRQKLAAQDYLSTLIELDPESISAEVTGPMIDFAPVEVGNGPLLSHMCDPEIRIVSLTVTEGGYFVDPSTGGFDVVHPEIQNDVANPTTPKTAFGAIVEALRLRRSNGLDPFTLLSCDNLLGNGNILRNAVVGLAKLRDPELASWINDNCSFPNSMVDCIVPATGEKELALIKELGVNDLCPVTHENFRQWVIEDDFCAGRPNWEKVGVTFTSEVHEFEALKIRILNGGHQILANAAEVLSVETMAGAMAHDKIGAFFRKVATLEILPHLSPAPGMMPADYVELIDRRFSNPRIVDTARRVAFDGSSRHPGFVIPSIQDALKSGTPVEGLALAEAVWARMCAGTREDGSVIEANDPVWNDLKACAERAKDDPDEWLAQAQYYQSAGTDPRFKAAFGRWLSMIWSEGLDFAIDTYLAA